MLLTAIVFGVISYCVWSLLHDSPSPRCGVYRLPGQWYFLKRVFFYILYRVRRWQQRTVTETPSLGREGPGWSVAGMEAVQTLKDHPQALDAVYFAGFNDEGVSVVCRVGRRPEKRAEVWLFLDIPGVGRFQHPIHPDTAVCNTGAGLTAGGLHLEMVEPMRAWRISYCGPLRKGLCNTFDGEGGEYVHVKFSFLWRAFNDPFDFDVDIDPWSLSDAVAREVWTQEFWERLKSKQQTHYEQWGELRGRLAVEGTEERQLCLKCVRNHTYGVWDWRSFYRYVVHFIYLESGMVIQCGIVSRPDTMSHLMVGYLSYPSGFTVPVSQVMLDITEVGEHTDPPDHYTFSIVADGKTYLIGVQSRVSPVWYHHDDRGGKVVEKLCNFTVNRHKGYGVAEFFYRNADGPVITSPEVSLPLVTNVDDALVRGRQFSVVLPFTDPACCSAQLVGGKGAQLAQLSKLQKELDVCVPQGFCVTTFAYQQHVKLLSTREPVFKGLMSSKELPGLLCKLCASVHKTEMLKCMCEEIQEIFSQSHLTSDIREGITRELSLLWGDSVEKTCFAVRSSASGEDGCESSTAGQLDTYLGLVGLQQVVEGVVKCWASAYSYQAVQYRRQQGQEVGVAVGVVVQEMVPADTAGVLFTKDPVTDNPSMMVINANYGLGESVVSGVSDADTIHIQRSWDGHMTIQSKVIGQKASIMKISESEGIESASVESHLSAECCLSDEIILKLGQTGTQLEKYFGSARDVEWAVTGRELYLLQARPVTSQDVETDEELIHEFDSGLASDQVWLTTGNISEMMPGAVTPLTYSVFGRGVDQGLQAFMGDGGVARVTRQAGKAVVCFCNHLFISLHSISHMYQNCVMGRKDFANISLLGEALPELSSVSLSQHIRHQGLLSRVCNNIRMIQIQRRSGPACERLEKTVLGYIPSRSGHAAYIYDGICHQLMDYDEVWKRTMIVSSTSGSWSTIVLSVLTGGSSDVTSEHFADLASLLSNCTDVLSADVPHLLQNLAADIDKAGFKDLFVSITTEAATSWLQSSDSGEVGEKFCSFLRDHGHRSIKEAEMMVKSWKSEPGKLTKILQSMLKSSVPLNAMCQGPDVEEAISKLKSPVTWLGKQVLQRLVPIARFAVGRREWGKSLAIRMSDIVKESYWTLAECMVKEGRLPDQELLFFLTHYEIGQLLQTRSPRLINKAIRRRRLFPKQMELQFPKYSIGPAIPVQGGIKEKEDMTTTLQLKGMPVSKGEITGRACIIKNVEDADSIQTGDVLIVPYTDVGWSPYFPLIGGLVTEIGGLLSHGAVVAREYGLPCVVSVPMATSVFKSGDRVHLDGSKGIIEKVV